MPLEIQPLPSRVQVGEVAYFQPVIQKIDNGTSEEAIPCRVVGITFDGGKVLYDLALPDGEGGFYLMYPLLRVDSYFVVIPKE